jgi:hypothetical protein
VSLLRQQLVNVGVKNTTVRHEDFLSVDPSQEEFADVKYILVDPSCSGSGRASFKADNYFTAGHLHRLNKKINHYTQTRKWTLTNLLSTKAKYDRLFKTRGLDCANFHLYKLSRSALMLSYVMFC